MGGQCFGHKGALILSFSAHGVKHGRKFRMFHAIFEADEVAPSWQLYTSIVWDSRLKPLNMGAQFDGEHRTSWYENSVVRPKAAAAPIKERAPLTPRCPVEPVVVDHMQLLQSPAFGRVCTYKAFDACVSQGLTAATQGGRFRPWSDRSRGRNRLCAKAGLGHEGRYVDGLLFHNGATKQRDRGFGQVFG